MSNLEIIYAYNTHKLQRGSLKINQYMSFIKSKKKDKQKQLEQIVNCF